MRVIAGYAGGRKLIAPTGMDIRPTTDRMKENLFNILAAGIYGARFLDVFSGTGAIGIEALSRGAESAVFIDTDTMLLNKNLILTGLSEKATVLKRDYTSAIRLLTEKRLAFDIVFMDPPYRKGLIAPAAGLISSGNLLSSRGVLAVELPPDEDPPQISDLYLYKAKRYSTCVFFFYQKEI